MRDAFLLDYAAGALPPGPALLAAAHVRMKPDARSDFGAIEAAGGALLEDARPVAVGADARAAALRAIEANEADHAEPPRPVADPVEAATGLHSGAIRWRWVMPGMKRFRLDQISDGRHAVELIKLEAGRRIPRHSHGGSETTLVLVGSYRDHTGAYGPGDVAFADGDVEHAPEVGPDGDCICLTVTEGGLSLRESALGLLRAFFSGAGR